MAESNHPQKVSISRIFVKGLILFILLDLLCVPLAPGRTLGRVSLYNHLFPGRVRLPYGENPDQAYNFSLYNLEAMFASHVLAAGDKPADEYRVVLIGDSSVWGYLLKPEQTLAADINAAGLRTVTGKRVRAYNMGYPTLSLTKDLVMLEYAMRYQPDLVVWLLTLESFPRDKQLGSPILQNNPALVRDLISRYSLDLDAYDPRLVEAGFWGQTLIGQRRSLADLLRLQLYGVLWAASGVDQYYPASYDPPQSNLAEDATFQGLQPPQLSTQDLALEVLSAGTSMAGKVPIVFVNEPIYLSQGEHSDIRYNFFYPRWAYDQYRRILAEACLQNGWQCLDAWDLVAAAEFTNSAIHMSPAGTQQLASEIEKAIITQSER